MHWILVTRGAAGQPLCCGILQILMKKKYYLLNERKLQKWKN